MERTLLATADDPEKSESRRASVKS